MVNRVFPLSQAKVLSTTHLFATTAKPSWIFSLLGISLLQWSLAWLKKVPRYTCICTDCFYLSKYFKYLLRSSHPAKVLLVLVVWIYRRPDITLCVHCNLTTPSFNFFASMKTNRLTLLIGFGTLGFNNQMCWCFVRPLFASFFSCVNDWFFPMYCRIGFFNNDHKRFSKQGNDWGASPTDCLFCWGKKLRWVYLASNVYKLHHDYLVCGLRVLSTFYAYQLNLKHTIE